jgi:hypothetical protein
VRVGRAVGSRRDSRHAAAMQRHPRCCVHCRQPPLAAVPLAPAAQRSDTSRRRQNAAAGCRPAVPQLGCTSKMLLAHRKAPGRHAAARRPRRLGMRQQRRQQLRRCEAEREEGCSRRRRRRVRSGAEAACCLVGAWASAAGLLDHARPNRPDCLVPQPLPTNAGTPKGPCQPPPAPQTARRRAPQATPWKSLRASPPTLGAARACAAPAGRARRGRPRCPSVGALRR